jgi:uncharacterized protein YuzE
MKPVSYYAAEGDIAYIRVRQAQGLIRSREESWGLLDCDESGEVVALEIWDASKQLPSELIDALPHLEGPGVVIEAEKQPA